MDRADEVRAFVSARGTALSRTAYLLTGNRHSAEDLVQETYVEMVRQWSRIERSNPEPYVRRIMYSRFIDGLRRRRLVEWPTAALLEVPQPDDESSHAVDRMTLQGALAQLTARQRAFLVLRFYDDLTEVQTAEALGVSTSTVKSQTRVALQRLRDLAPDVIASFHDMPEEVAE
jgi:RNA polymerase sigma-70 factor (sigma-E family)